MADTSNNANPLLMPSPLTEEEQHGASLQNWDAKPAEQEQPQMSWYERAAANAEDAWRTGTLAGAARTLHQSTGDTGERFVEQERARKQEFEEMKPWYEAPDFFSKASQFTAMLAGQVVGGLASPESLVGSIPKLGAKAAMWAAKGASGVEKLGRKAAVGAGNQAVISGATDPAIQGMNISAGVQDEYDPVQGALAPVVGAALGGATGATGVTGLPKVARTLEDGIKLRETVTGRKLENWEKEALQVALEHIPDTDKFGKYAGNINLDRIRAGEDVVELIKSTAESNASFIEAVRRGEISNVELRSMANDLGLTPEKFQEMVKDPGSILNAEYMLAARQLMVDASVDAVGAAKNLAKDASPEARAAFLERMALAQNLITKITAPIAESGRLQQQFNIIVPGEDRAKALQFVLEKNPELVKNADEMAAMVSSLDDPAGLRNMLRQMRASSKDPVGKMERFVEAWKAGLLTSFRTHEINILSNAVVNSLDIGTELVASGIGKGRNALFGGEEARSTKGAAQRAIATFMSPNEQLGAWANFMEAAKTAETPKIFRTANEVERSNAIGGKVGEAIRTPFRLLTAEDAFFKTIAARQELTALAWDDLIKQPNYEAMTSQERNDFVKSFIQEPSADVLRKITDKADELTFNKELGKLGKALQGITEQHPVAQLVAPFIRTPINIIKYGFEHTPLALLNPNIRNLRGQEFDKALAKVSMGTAFMGAMAMAAQEGKITGAGPDDPAKLAQLKSTGWQPFSVKVGDKYYPYERIQPLGMLMGIAADMQYINDDVSVAAEERGLIGPNGEVSKTDMYAAYAIHSFMENIVNSTFTTQINNLFKAFNDPTGNKMSNLVNSFSGSMVPNIVADVAKAVDPTIRVAEGPVEAVRARIPGMSEDLPAARDWTGEARVREHGPIEQMISPIHATTEKNDKTIREVARLQYSMPPVLKTLGDRKLSAEQREVYAEAAGNFRYDLIDKFVNSRGYDEIASGPGGDFRVKQAFGNLINKANKKAEAALIAAYPDLRTAEVDQTERLLKKEPVQPVRSLRNK